jgi:soluble lytic murein transglycosylase
MSKLLSLHNFITMRTAITALFITFLLIPLHLDADTLDKQRESFLAAEKAWQENNLDRYEDLKSSLGDYPLLVYLEYAELNKRFNKADSQQIEAFIKANKETAPGQQIRTRYLGRLAAEKQWKSFLDWFDPQLDTGPDILCKQLTALIKSGKGSKSYKQIETIWLTATSRPKSCDAVFSYWKKKGKLTRDLVWQRVDLAIRHGKPKLAKSLSKYLKSSDQHWLQLWIKLRTHPEATLVKLKGKHAFKGKMLGYGLARLAESDPDKALQMHSKMASDLSGEQRCQADTRLARAIQRQNGEPVYAFFKSVNACPGHTELHEARLKAALLRQRWNDVVSWYLEAPDSMRSETNWTYWYARALARTGDEAAARDLFGKLAKDRSFYAYLAADQLGDSYHWNHLPATSASGPLDEIRKHPAIQRIRELYHHERDTDARREWNYLIKKLDKQQLIAAAILFDQWGIHDRAIFTISMAGYWDDLVIRFPVKHKQLVTSLAKKQNIDPKWAFAILRQESAFMQDANSPVGALGLMQLMPKTARHVAKQLKIKRPKKDDILKPEINISLGTGYLAEMLEKFGNIALATAAYNAGPHRVSNWLYDMQLPGDIWVELIPFRETRGYVHRVLTYASIYDRLLGGDKHGISARTGTVPAIAVDMNN